MSRDVGGRWSRVFAVSLALGSWVGGCTQQAHPGGHGHGAKGHIPTVRPQSGSEEAAVMLAHEAYVKAINANRVDLILAAMTEDVVYLAPNEPRLVGRAEVKPWIEAYLKAYTTKWEKTTLELVVSGDWAFEQYGYKSTDVARAGGASVSDVGKGMNVYHHDADGVWRVARDAWNSDVPVAGR